MLIKLPNGDHVAAADVTAVRFWPDTETVTVEYGAGGCVSVPGGELVREHIAESVNAALYEAQR